MEVDFPKNEQTNSWLQTARLPGKQSIEHDDRTCLRIIINAMNMNAAAGKAFRIIADSAAHLSEPRIMAVRIWSTGEMNCLPELVGLSEIAEILNVTRQRVGQLAQKRGFPAAVANLAMGPVYVRHDLEDYARECGREVHKVSRSRRFRAK